MGAFSVVDLFLLNALTIVTEFLGITLALDYLGLPKNLGMLASAANPIIATAPSTTRTMPIPRSIRSYRMKRGVMRLSIT